MHTFPSQNINDEIILRTAQAVVGFSNNLPTACLKKSGEGKWKESLLSLRKKVLRNKIIAQSLSTGRQMLL